MAEVGDVILSVLIKVNAPTAVGSSALLDHVVINLCETSSLARLADLSPDSNNNTVCIQAKACNWRTTHADLHCRKSAH